MQQKSVKVRTSEVFCFSHFSAPLFCCGNPIFFFLVCLREEGTDTKGGEVKVQSPRLGGLWWSAWELERGKLWLEYEWNHRREGERREEREKADYGWISHHTMDRWGRLSPLTPNAATHQHGSHLGARLGQGGSNVPSDTGHMIGQTGIPLIYEGTTAGRSKWDEGTTKVLIRTNKWHSSDTNTTL